MEKKITLLDKLKKSGIRATPQRIAVLKYLFQDFNNHPTVEEICEALKESFPSLSPATVYSSLQSLKDAGIIQELSIRRDRVSYDPIPESHHHFYCEKCGKIFNINISCPVAKKGSFSGHTVKETQAYFYGICLQCSKKERSKK